MDFQKPQGPAHAQEADQLWKRQKFLMIPETAGHVRHVCKHLKIEGHTPSFDSSRLCLLTALARTG